jgi:hypothetical protein
MTKDKGPFYCKKCFVSISRVQRDSHDGKCGFCSLGDLI